MCSEKKKNVRKIRIVKFDKAIPLLQLQILATGLLLLAVALTRNRISGILLGLAFLVSLASVIWRFRKLYREGVAFEIEETTADSIADDIPDAEPEEPDQNEQADELEDSDHANEEVFEDRLKKHWSSNEFPDPDVELGLKDPPKTPPAEDS